MEFSARDPDIFQNAAWFENLQLCGLEHKPCWIDFIFIPILGGCEGGRLWLMRESTRSPLRSLSNYYSSLYGPVWDDLPLAERVDWATLARRIKKVPGSAVVQLQPLDEAGLFLKGVQAGLREAGYRTHRFFCFGNWYLPVVNGGFDAYWAQRPSILRRTVDRARRRLARAHEWHIEIVTQPGPQLEAGVRAYLAVYAQSWKQAERCPAFLPGLIRMAASQGSLRLGLLWLDGVVVAAQVWLVQGGKANIYKLAYVPGFERLSIGSVLTAALMRHVIDVDKVHEVDYLTGDDAYKQDWMSHRRERVGLLAFDPWRLNGLLAGARHLAGRYLGGGQLRHRNDGAATGV